MATTRPMEDFFNLPPEEEPVVENTPAKTQEQLLAEVNEISTALSTTDKVNYALPLVTGLDIHDSDMDAISRKAESAFNDLMALGGNVPDIHAGKIYEVGIQSLRLALDAKNSKAEKKLKMIELQLKKIRAEQIDFELGQGPQGGSNGVEFDRNELLKLIVSSKTENSDK